MTSTTIKLPTGDAPGWEETDGNELKDPASSLVILQSLNQSRNNWMTSVFPKFSSKGKSKQTQDTTLPPHNIRQVGKYDVRLGPHVFPDTVFYEVSHFKKTSSKQASTSAGVPVSTNTFHYRPTSHSLVSGSVPYSSSASQAGPATTSRYSQPIPAPAPTIPSSDTSKQSSSLDLSIDVSPSLVAQVNSAAATNSTLQYLLQSAAEGTASVDQLKTLGLLIQSVASQSGTRTVEMFPSLAASSSSRQPLTNTTTIATPAAPVVPAKSAEDQAPAERTDLVLEFQENLGDKWLIPREIQSFQARPNIASSQRKDLILCFLVPFEGSKSAASEDQTPKAPAVMRICNVNHNFVDFVSKWVNSEAKSVEAQKKFKQDCKENPRRVYLQHRLEEDSSLHNQLQSLSNTYPMKHIKPSAFAESGRAKRIRTKKQQPTAPTQIQTPTPTPISSTDLEDSVPTPASTFTSTPTPAPAPTKSGASKRRRSSQIKPALTIACNSCGQTDVPLLMGGRYCRPCVESDKAQPSLVSKKSEFRMFNPSVYVAKTTQPPPPET